MCSLAPVTKTRVWRDPGGKISYKVMSVVELLSSPDDGAFAELIDRLSPMLDHYPDDCRSEIVQKWSRARARYVPTTEGQTLRWLSRSADWAARQHNRPFKHKPIPGFSIGSLDLDSDKESFLLVDPDDIDRSDLILDIERIAPMLGRAARQFLNGERDFTEAEKEALQELIGAAFMI